ncbi:hypothetical protein DXG01_014108 [Tephrocybe rancida]|nr:hypothetical protein DXG01_014108 [Tephrocybe rancida]
MTFIPRLVNSQPPVYLPACHCTMTSGFSAPFSRKRVLGVKGYVASPNFLSTVSWKPNNGGFKLAERLLPSQIGSDQKKPRFASDAICVVVGVVSEHNLHTTSMGNYNPTYPKQMTAVKFVLSLVMPDDPEFKSDYSTALDNITKLQDAVSTGSNNKWLIVGDKAANRTLRLSAPIMEVRSEPLGSDDPLDEDTRNCVVPEQYRDTFDALQASHKITPLRVFDQHNFRIVPENVQQTLKGSLVEVYFSMNQIYFERDAYNSFTGTIQQICVICPASDMDSNPFRTHRGKGPYRPIATPSRSEQKKAADTFLVSPPVPVDAALPKDVALRMIAPLRTPRVHPPVGPETGSSKPASGSSGAGPSDYLESNSNALEVSDVANQPNASSSGADGLPVLSDSLKAVVVNIGSADTEKTTVEVDDSASLASSYTLTDSEVPVEEYAPGEQAILVADDTVTTAGGSEYPNKRRRVRK